MGVFHFSMFCCTLLYVHSSFAIILTGMRELVAFYWCLVIVMWLFLAVPLVCLLFVIVVFPDHTGLLFFCENVNIRRRFCCRFLFIALFFGFFLFGTCSSFTNSSLGKSELFVYFTCLLVPYDVTVSIFFLFLAVPWVGLLCLIVILAYFPVCQHVELVPPSTYEEYRQTLTLCILKPQNGYIG